MNIELILVVSTLVSLLALLNFWDSTKRATKNEFIIWVVLTIFLFGLSLAYPFLVK